LVPLRGLASGLNHLAMPASRGLFARAIARALGVEPTVAGMTPVPVSRTVAVTTAEINRFARGLLWAGRRPLPTGTACNELVNLMAHVEQVGVVRPLIRPGDRARPGRRPRAAGGVPHRPRQITDTSDLLEAVWTDWGFRIPTTRLVEARSAPSWLYEFRCSPPPSRRCSAPRDGLALPFVRDDLDLATPAGPAG
jgi:carboxylesterase type B